MKIEIQRLEADSILPHFDVMNSAARVCDELLRQLDLPPPSSPLIIVFGADRGEAQVDRILMPSRYQTPVGCSEEDVYGVYLKHELVHYFLQSLYRINPSPTAFINEGTAQSQAEGPWTREHFGYDYHDLSAAICRRHTPASLSDHFDSGSFLKEWRRFSNLSLVARTASFCGWAVEEYGILKWKEVFRRATEDGADSASNTRSALELALGLDCQVLEAQWRRGIALRGNPAAESKAARWLEDVRLLSPDKEEGGGASPE